MNQYKMLPIIINNTLGKIPLYSSFNIKAVMENIICFMSFTIF